MRKVQLILAVLFSIGASAGWLLAEDNPACQSVDDLKKHSEQLKALFDQFKETGAPVLKGTPACYDWELAYRTQLDTVSACSETLREKLLEPPPKKKGPLVDFVVKSAIYGDLVNDDACNATTAMRRLVKETCDKEASQAGAGYLEVEPGRYYCTVAPASSSDGIPDAMCGYKPSPYLKAFEQAFDIKLGCAPKHGDGDMEVKLFRVPGHTSKITLACVADDKDKLRPFVAPGRHLKTEGEAVTFTLESPHEINCTEEKACKEKPACMNSAACRVCKHALMCSGQNRCNGLCDGPSMCGPPPNKKE